MNRRLLALASLPLVGGLASAQVELQPRLGDPVKGLSAAELAEFEASKLIFNTPLAVEDGLGPIFNDVSCGNCHSSPAVGGGSVRSVTRFGQAASGPNPFDPLDFLGGTLLQEQAISIPCEEHIPPRADVTADRLTPITFGSGLLSLVDDADILALEASQPAGLNGFANMVPLLEDPMAPPQAAKFGWKGGIATVHSFSFDASSGEMSLTTWRFPEDQKPNGSDATTMMCDTVADPEDVAGPDGLTLVDHFTRFQTLLAAPSQTPKAGMTGELVFESVGCADCHVTQAFVTGIHPTYPQLSGQPIKPYSDFLLHDMGALGDGIVEGAAAETVMQTRALWGLQARNAFLHDGRATGGTFADNMHMAIDEHDGEAAASRASFQALSTGDQDLLIDFLGSLGRIEFDWERDNDVDEFDYFFIEPFLTDPVPSLTPDDPGALGDVDQDGDFDLRDFGALQRAFTGNL